jgi:hypothetical protein
LIPLIVTDVPFDTQVKVELPPGEIEVGDAVSVIESVDDTVTVTVAVAVPPGPVAVAVYVVVAAGVTVAELAGAKPVPTPLSISTVVAFVVDHESVEEAPGAIDIGNALKVIVGAGDRAATVTWAVAVPPEPVAVATKVVVVFTTTVAVPESPSEVWSSPRMLGVTLNAVAFVVVHVNVTKPPAATELTSEVKVIVGGAAVTVMVTVCEVVPPAPVAVAV